MNTNPLFSTAERMDGLTYVTPLPAGHPAYRLHRLVSKIGQVFDRILFF